MHISGNNEQVDKDYDLMFLLSMIDISTLTKIGGEIKTIYIAILNAILLILIFTPLL